MKRLLAMLCIVAFLMPCFALAVCAASPSDPFDYLLDEQMVTTFCRYDAENSRVLVGGSIRHDILLQHSEDMLEIYALLPNEEVRDVVNNAERTPVASSALSVRFEFSIEAKTITEKYARYCVVLRAPDNENWLATKPKYAELSSSFHFERGDRSAYKGIGTSLVSLATDAGAGRLVLPVEFDRLSGTAAGGVLFRYLGENLYFDENYIETLDLQIRSAGATDTQVYLQFLTAATEEGEEQIYPLPDVYDEAALFWLEAVTAFFCRRYQGNASGTINGIVVGKDIDRAMVGEVTQYAKTYVLYLLAVGNTARNILPNLDIVLPFSDVHSYRVDSNHSAPNTPAKVLEAVLSVLDTSMGSPFVCTTWIEGHTLPLLLDDEPSGRRLDWTKTAGNDTLHAANLSDYEAYLERLSHTYKSAPVAFSFVWSIEESLDMATLDAMYVYSYFKLLALSRLSSFVISFHAQEQSGNTGGFAELSHLYTYIDTDAADAETEHVREALGIESFQELYGEAYGGALVLRALYERRAALSLPKTVRGKFSYADFSTAFQMDGWVAGYACNAMRLAYGPTGSRALQMELTADAVVPAEAFWLYEYPENFVYTPYVALHLFLEADNVSSLYEVTVTVGEGKNRQITTAAVRPNEDSLFVMELSEYSREHMADYWKISVRALDGSTQDVSVWIYDIAGYSTTMDAETLREAIMTERARIRNLSNDNHGQNPAQHLWTVVAVVVLVVFIGIGILIFVRSGDDSAKEREENDAP